MIGQSVLPGCVIQSKFLSCCPPWAWMTQSPVLRAQDSPGTCSSWGCRAPTENSSSTERRWEWWAENILTVHTHCGVEFFKMLSPGVRHGVIKLLLCPQLLSKLSNCSACSIFTSGTFLDVPGTPFLALLPCWVYFGNPTEGGQGTELLFSNPNPSLPKSLGPGAGRVCPELCSEGRIWGVGLAQPFCC